MAKGEKKRTETHLAECPTFKLDLEDYSSLEAFLSNVRASVEKWGACKVVLPPGKERQFAVDLSQWVLSTSKQRVHELQERASGEASVEDCYHQWLAFTKGPPFQKHPHCGSQPVNIFKLYTAVQRRGGFERVSGERSWREICRILQVSSRSDHRLILPMSYCANQHISK